MTPEAPEFHTKTLSPLSPLPVHPTEPSGIPVLRNQIDPVFNMTSTHLEPTPPTLAVAASADPIFEPTSSKGDSPSANSSFSDAYKEEPAENEEIQDTTVKQGSDVSDDDYAMTFDSEGEERTDSRDIPQANIKPEATSLSVQTTLASVDPFGASPVKTVFHDGPATLPTPPNPSSTQTYPVQISDSSGGNPTQAIIDTTDIKPHSYDDIASGGIDIQQLLDNITANAEKNEQAVANTTLSTQPSNIPLSKPSSGLPTHSSLPPRPNIPQKRPYDDIQKYHANTPGLPPAASSYRPPGGAPALIAAGAPGTSTDPRGGLPPPPTGSFRPPPSSATSPIIVSHSQINRLPPGRQTQSIESQDEGDELDAKWGPEVQKVYDEFLENERMYVTEGLWDRFPNGSRLFIG